MRLSGFQTRLCTACEFKHPGFVGYINCANTSKTFLVLLPNALFKRVTSSKLFYSEKGGPAYQFLSGVQ